MLLGMGGGSARQSRVVSVLSARAFISMSCFCRFLLSTASLLLFEVFINKSTARLDVTCVSCNILTVILSVIRKKVIRKVIVILNPDYRL